MHRMLSVGVFLMVFFENKFKKLENVNHIYISKKIISNETVIVVRVHLRRHSIIMCVQKKKTFSSKRKLKLLSSKYRRTKCFVY
jgi:hypothetical protein